MNITFSDLTSFGKLLLIPTVAVMVATGYFGSLLIKERFFGVRYDSASVGWALLLFVPTVAATCGAGALFFALSSHLLQDVGLGVFKPSTTPPSRSAQQDAVYSAQDASPPKVKDDLANDLSSLLNIDWPNLTLLGRLLLIPTVAVAVAVAYLRPRNMLYFVPGAGILFVALSALVLRAFGLRVTHLTTPPDPHTVRDEREVEGDTESEMSPADSSDSEAIFVRKTAKESISARPFVSEQVDKGSHLPRYMAHACSYNERVDEQRGRVYDVTGHCCSCNTAVTLTVNTVELTQLRPGDVIQDVLISSTESEREFLVSGICEVCFSAPRSTPVEEAFAGKPFDPDSLRLRFSFKQPLILAAAVFVLLSSVALTLFYSRSVKLAPVRNDAKLLEHKGVEAVGEKDRPQVEPK